MVRDYVTEAYVSLVCRNRSTCRAKGRVKIIGGALKVKKINGVYKMMGDQSDVVDIDNYGDNLEHFHTKRYKG